VVLTSLDSKGYGRLLVPRSLYFSGQKDPGVPTSLNTNDYRRLLLVTSKRFNANTRLFFLTCLNPLATQGYWSYQAYNPLDTGDSRSKKE
jgi:hypothetical protein